MTRNVGIGMMTNVRVRLKFWAYDSPVTTDSPMTTDSPSGTKPQILSKKDQKMQQKIWILLLLNCRFPIFCYGFFCILPAFCCPWAYGPWAHIFIFFTSKKLFQNCCFCSGFPDNLGASKVVVLIFENGVGIETI